MQKLNTKRPAGGTAAKSWTNGGNASDVNTVTHLCATVSFVKTKSETKRL